LRRIALIRRRVEAPEAAREEELSGSRGGLKYNLPGSGYLLTLDDLLPVSFLEVYGSVLSSLSCQSGRAEVPII
jgi:hypothetical protein